ncbi:MAG: site-specific DNA-methyltransferase, partial [Hyphomonas sp.]
MTQNQKQRTRLIGLLKELFQLDQPDLDFGLYRIMHAKADQVSRFLDEDLLKIIQDAFGEADEAKLAEALATYEAAKKQAADYGAPEPDATPPVMKAKAALDAVRNAETHEGDVYDHLYRFFERYYDAGDFMSRRYFARETDGKAAPYAVPYDGREVYLHWANRDQYYIKTSEYLTNFTFDVARSPDLPDALAKMVEGHSRPVLCRIVAASEGEHNNVKATEQTERFFVIHDDEPVLLETNDAGLTQLVLQFEYKPLPGKKYVIAEAREKELKEKYGAKNKGDLPLLDMADRLMAALPDEAEAFRDLLATKVPTDGIKERTLLAKYLRKYTARNTMDYFIHKDLGGFLRRELDFYIKNEIMRLDDIETADAAQVEAYLARVKVLRRIARHLIDFLAQLEDFQKKLWLKKKFVTDTQYCITLDRIPEDFYAEIAANEAQREEWVRLFAIDALEGYSAPLTVDFLKANDKLLIDTALFGADFRDRVVSEMEGLDAGLGGYAIHSDNAQGLRFIGTKNAGSIQCTYIDPPYNTGSDGFVYKDALKASSWTCMIHERLFDFQKLPNELGVIFVSINEIQRSHLDWCLQSVFGSDNRVEELIWARDTVSNNAPLYSTNHEYIEVFARDKSRVENERSMFREERPGYAEVMTVVDELADEYPPISEIEARIKAKYGDHRTAHMSDAQELGMTTEEAKKADPWKGLYPYKYAEYRTADGVWVAEKEAKVKDAQIWVFREVEPSMPSGKQASDIRDPESENYRFYSPPHPETKKPCKPPKRGWAFPRKAIGSRPSFEAYDHDKRIVFKSDETTIPQLKYFLHEVGSIVSTSVIRQYADGEPRLEAHFGEKGLIDNPKPPALVERLIRQTTNTNSNVLDFFAGSGTTGCAVVDANRNDEGNRKFHLIEVGSYFDTVLLPRLQKAVYSQSWEDGKPISRDGLSHAFKYLRLESYEDALNNLALRPAPDLRAAGETFRRDYMLKYWLEFETKGSPSLLNIQTFDDPTDYRLNIKTPGTDEYKERAVDLVETFNWLIGLH